VADTGGSRCLGTPCIFCNIRREGSALSQGIARIPFSKFHIPVFVMAVPGLSCRRRNFLYRSHPENKRNNGKQDKTEFRCIYNRRDIKRKERNVNRVQDTPEQEKEQPGDEFDPFPPDCKHDRDKSNKYFYVFEKEDAEIERKSGHGRSPERFNIFLERHCIVTLRVMGGKQETDHWFFADYPGQFLESSRFF